MNASTWSSSFWFARVSVSWPANKMEIWLQRLRQWLSMKTVQEIALTPCYQHPVWDVTGPVIGEEVIAFQINFGRGKLGFRNDSVVVLKALKESTLKTPKSPHLFLSKLCCFLFPGLRINNSAERQEEVNHSRTFSIPFQPGML